MPIAPDMVDTVQNYDVDDLLYASSGGSGGNNTIRVQSTQEIVSRRELVHVDMADSYDIPVEDGYIRFGHYESTGPAYTTQEIQRVTQDAVDSNTSIIKRSTIKQPYNTSVDPQTGKMTVSGQPKSGMLSTNAAYFINAVNAAQFCTSTGVALGKGFDSYLYNANPDYWDSIGLQTLNPETWASLTSENESLGARVFNAIFGIDPDTGNAQMYMDADAFAYIAQCMKEAGILETGETVANTYTPIDDTWTISQVQKDTLILPVYVGGKTAITSYGRTSVAVSDYDVYSVFAKKPWDSTSTQWDTVAWFFSEHPFTAYHYNNNTPSQTFNDRVTQKTINGKTYYYTVSGSATITNNVYTAEPQYTEFTVRSPVNMDDTFIYMIFNTQLSTSGGVDGVTDQPNATLPDTSDWTDQQSTDASLRQQYPDLYNNSIKYDVPDAQGNIIEKEYIPVAWPNSVGNPWTDTQPTTDTSVQTQTNTMVNLLTGLATQVDNLTKTITQTANTTPTGTLPPAENPTDTGSGSSPVPVSTSGSSSKLWSVYHPTQVQVDAFGAWLWSTNFIDQIMKMFQNPMEGIISLHKVFATPIDAGTGNIIVGTLDSGVASATVTQQYVYVSCGSVDCHEDFGNVFDYSPHTQVSLYLPFIGIVPLDVSDVMRSTITIEYGVDMFTGACLAMVKVSRDGATVNMYQYAGSASVEYPLSNVQQSQLLSGILAVAAGGAAIATGGMSMSAGAAVIGGAANAMKSNVGRSGGFSGNAGAMGIKKPYLIIQRPQTKVASLFPRLAGYPTNISGQLSDFSGQVKVTDVHVEGIPATDVELTQIEELLHSGVLV